MRCGRRRSNRVVDDGMSEDALHRAVVANLQQRLAPGVSWYHPANGGHRDRVTAARLKGLGVRAGTPDLALVVQGRAHFLELKRAKGGSVSAEQRAMLAELRAAGAVVAIARGLTEALHTLEAWGALRGSTAKCQKEAVYGP